jgi:REP element-mobilizing transposase RayT
MRRITKFLHRNGSNRAKWWDYTNPGTYYITICTRNRYPYFGSIRNGRICLSEEGKIAYDCWQSIPEHFTYIKLGEFIIMPDHLHGILVNSHQHSSSLNFELTENGPLISFNGLQPEECLKLMLSQKMSSISPKSNSISTVIRSYKSAVSNFIHQFNPDFGWQPRFHDRIIRSKIELASVNTYIKNNPAFWHPRDRKNG